MAHLRGLADLGVQLNSPHLGDWPVRIGQFILNFGGVELISYQFLNILEPTRGEFNRNLGAPLSQRIDRVVALVEASSHVPAGDREEIGALWDEARELAKWRNRIAHNPVLPTWKPGSDAATSPPDLLGVPDMKQLKGGSQSDSISLAGLMALIDATVSVATRLNAAAAKLRASAPAV